MRSASNDVEHAEFDYVVAADGAHSAVRQLCGIDMAGALNLQTIANVHFTSRSLSAAARENPAMLYFVVREAGDARRWRSSCISDTALGLCVCLRSSTRT